MISGTYQKLNIHFIVALQITKQIKYICFGLG